MSRYFEESDLSDEDITLTKVSRHPLSPGDNFRDLTPPGRHARHRTGHRRNSPSSDTRSRRKSSPRDSFGRMKSSPRDSFGTTESLSTIPTGRDSELIDDDPPDVREVYVELQEINRKMKQEFRVLNQRGILLNEKERSLEAAETMLNQTIQGEVEKALAARDQQHKNEMEKLELILREKTKEHRRLKENFDILKNCNDNLRTELSQVQQQHSKLEKQSSSLQHRLTNMQRKQEYQDRKDTDDLPADLGKVAKPVSKEHKGQGRKSKACGSIYDVVGVLLEWLCEVHLRPAASTTSHNKKVVQTPLSSVVLQDRCLKVLPHLVELLRDLPSTAGSSRLMLPSLQFTYWSLLHLDQAQNQQQLKASMSSTLRRLGEELYRPKAHRYTEDDPGLSEGHGGQVKDGVKDKQGLYFRSGSLHIRVLSSLVILKTITQVDHLAQVYEVLRTDLKSETGKELFMHYQATPVLLAHLKPSNKGLMLSAIDIYLHMSVGVVRGFLESCSTETWFRTVSMSWRMPGLDEKVLEKLSIIMQKLSKLRCNRKYFEVFGLTSSIQEILRTKGPTNAFLTLNLKSVLFNLSESVPKTTDQPVSATAK